MNKNKTLLLLCSVFVLLSNIWINQVNASESEGSLPFSLSPSISRPSAKSNGRGSEIESLVSQYGIDYEEDPLLQLSVKKARGWYWEDAYKELESVIEENPRYWDAYRLQAELYLVNNEALAARGQIDRVLENNPRDLHALTMSILADQMLGDQIQVKTKMTYLTSLDPEFAKKIDQAFTLVNTWTNMLFDNEAVSPEDFQIIAVFGEEPNPDGSPSNKVKKKLKLAKQFLEINPEASIILSGGPVDYEFSEARSMSDYLQSLGIDPSKIILDEEARDTVGNAMGTIRIMKELNLTKVLIITHIDHLARSLANVEAVSVLEEYPLVLKGAFTGKQMNQANNTVNDEYIYYNVFKALGLIEKK